MRGMDILSLLGLFLSVVFAALAWRRTRGLPEASVIRWLVPLFVVAAVPSAFLPGGGNIRPPGAALSTKWMASIRSRRAC